MVAVEYTVIFMDFQKDSDRTRQRVALGETVSHFFIPTESAEDWKRFLADENKHWKDNHSAKALAYCWEEANGFPSEIAKLFSESEIVSFQHMEILLAFPEYQVSLPGGSTASQNDIFVLSKGANGQLISIAVEGKVEEEFGPLLGKWRKDASEGKGERLAFLMERLGLTEELPDHIRYQLLHRTASAVIEARRFNAEDAVMIVHSFSENDKWFEDYLEFLKLYHATAAPNELIFLKHIHGIDLYCGWARGNPKFLKI